MLRHFPHTIFLLLTCCSYADTIGVIGGFSGSANVQPNTPYGALVDSSLAIQAISNLPEGTYAFISSVAINSSGFSIFGGHQGPTGSSGGSYCQLIDPSGNATLCPRQGSVSLFGVSNNSSANGVVCGSYGPAILMRVSPTGNLTSISIGGPIATLATTAINDSNLAVAGGNQSYLLFPGNTFTQLQGNSARAAINTDGNSIFISGNNFTTYNSSGTQIATTNISNANLLGASLTDIGLSLLGGTLQSIHPYAAIADLSGNVTPIASNLLPNLGVINSVSFSEMGIGIIGGQNTGVGAYAAYIYPRGIVYSLPGLPTDPNATINSVSINDWGFALLGGTSDGTNAYAALATPWGALYPLPINSPQVIYSVSIRNFVPTAFIPKLTGNNLIFAKYLNQNAHKKLFYFLPSLADQTFISAIESAAPTRNAISLFALTNNFFFLNHSLSAHLRSYRHLQSRVKQQFLSHQSALASGIPEEKLTAATELDQLISPEDAPSSSPEIAPYYLWFQAIGAYVNQKAQDETVGSNPATGGGILGFEPIKTEHGQFGLGAAYTFTRVSEHESAGTSYINQEYAFLYGAWNNRRWHLDAALWGGLFQTRQIRLIDLTSFTFHASSRPTGYQASPHLELGCDKPIRFGREKQHEFTLDLFAMADWPNVWQGSYQEKGNGPFNARQTSQYASFLRTETGFRFYETFRCRCTLFTLQEKISYVYRHPFHIGTITGALVGSPGSFTLETFTAPENLGAAELTLIIEPIHSAHPAVFLSYQGELGSTYNSQQLTLDLTWNF